MVSKSVINNRVEELEEWCEENGGEFYNSESRSGMIYGCELGADVGFVALEESGRGSKLTGIVEDYGRLDIATSAHRGGFDLTDVDTIGDISPVTDVEVDTNKKHGARTVEESTGKLRISTFHHDASRGPDHEVLDMDYVVEVED